MAYCSRGNSAGLRRAGSTERSARIRTKAASQVDAKTHSRGSRIPAKTEKEASPPLSLLSLRSPPRQRTRFLLGDRHTCSREGSAASSAASPLLCPGGAMAAWVTRLRSGAFSRPLGRLGASALCSGTPDPPGRRPLQQQQQQEEAAEQKLTRTWQQNGIRNIILNNPRKRNALSLSMLKSLREDLLHDIESTDLRVIIISGEGPVFSSGHDLKELTHEEGKKHHMEVFEICSEVMTLLPKLPVPVIAKVQGLATAAGCQLVASCDIAVVSEKSKFGTPGVNVGLFCSTPAVAVGRSLPRKVVLEMLFTGEPMTAQEALLHGLVSKVVPEDKLEEETLRIAHKICETSRSVLALGKAAFYKQMEQDVSTAYRMTTQVMVDNLALKDGQEGIQAFISKRKPVWSHS